MQVTTVPVRHAAGEKTGGVETFRDMGLIVVALAG